MSTQLIVPPFNPAAVLELNAGDVQKYNIRVGDVVRHTWFPATTQAAPQNDEQAPVAEETPVSAEEEPVVAETPTAEAAPAENK